MFPPKTEISKSAGLRTSERGAAATRPPAGKRRDAAAAARVKDFMMAVEGVKLPATPVDRALKRDLRHKGKGQPTRKNRRSEIKTRMR